MHACFDHQKRTDLRASYLVIPSVLFTYGRVPVGSDVARDVAGDVRGGAGGFDCRKYKAVLVCQNTKIILLRAGCLPRAYRLDSLLDTVFAIFSTETS